MVVDGGRAVTLIIEGDGDSDICDNGGEGTKNAVAAGDWNELPVANGSWDVRLSQKLSNGHQLNVVGEAPSGPD